MNKLIHLDNIDSFIKKGGKFLYTNGNNGMALTYIHNHIINSIYFTCASLRASNIYSVDNCKENGMLPVQQIDVESISKMLTNARLSKDDKICVYGDANTQIQDTLFVFYTLSKFGLNMYYLNLDWKTLPSKYMTQEIPVYKKICEKYKYTDYNINAEDTVKASHSKNVKIIDVRPPKYYLGIDNTFPINGHIPTAINIFWQQLMIPSSIDQTSVTQTFQSKSFIKKLLHNNNIYKNNDIIVYCNTGSEITVMFFAITQILGWKNVNAFQGSWSVYQYLNSKCPNKYKVVTNT